MTNEHFEKRFMTNETIIDIKTRPQVKFELLLVNRMQNQSHIVYIKMLKGKQT